MMLRSIVIVLCFLLSVLQAAHAKNAMLSTYPCDYVALRLSRLPEDAKSNPEVLAQLSAGYAVYKGVAKVGEGLSALDDATGNIVSGALHKIGEGCEWVGTQARRVVRDDLGFSQRVGQNVGDLAQIAAEALAPGAAVAGGGSIGKIVRATTKTVVEKSKIASKMKLQTATAQKTRSDTLAAPQAKKVKLTPSASQAADGMGGQSAYSVSTRQANRDAAIIGTVDKVKIGDGVYTSYNRDAIGSVNTSLRHKAVLAFQDAGILTKDGMLTEKAIKEAKEVSLKTAQNPEGLIKNEAIRKALTIDGSDIADWHKYKTRSVKLRTGESRQIHFYMNEKTGKVDYITKDFKVSSDISLDEQLRSAGK